MMLAWKLFGLKTFEPVCTALNKSNLERKNGRLMRRSRETGNVTLCKRLKSLSGYFLQGKNQAADRIPIKSVVSLLFLDLLLLPDLLVA